MGGYGSGPYGWTGGWVPRQTVEEATLPVDVRWCHREGLLTPHASGVMWQGHASVAYSSDPGGIVLSYRWTTPDHASAGQTRLPVRWTPCRFGGRRPWWACPRCHQSVQTVYFAAGGFGCRRCQGMTYTSCQTSGDDFRRTRRRVIQRLRTLGSDAEYPAPGFGWGAPDPPRPRYMHQRTYTRLLEDLHRAEANHEQAAHEDLVRVARRYSR